MDLELLDWLNTHTFVEEAKYQELDYAEKAYDIFAEDMLKSPTTRACVFGTIHNEAKHGSRMQKNLRISGLSLLQDLFQPVRMN